MARLRMEKELVGAVCVSVILHALWLAKDARASFVPDAEPQEVFLETVAPPPPPPPAPPVVPDQPAPKEVEREVARPQQSPRAPQPVAAQAGKTLTAADDAGPSDLADFTMVQGEGSEYVGGTTTSVGTSKLAVKGPVGVVGPTQRGPVGPVKRPVEAVVSGPDQSRRATPLRADWNCSRLFPSDPEAGDYAAVLIAVTVQADGSPANVAVIRDPGHGFGAAARACAMSQRFNPAWDREGRPISATTPPITVRFTR